MALEEAEGYKQALVDIEKEKDNASTNKDKH